MNVTAYRVGEAGVLKAQTAAEAEAARERGPPRVGSFQKGESGERRGELAALRLVARLQLFALFRGYDTAQRQPFPRNLSRAKSERVWVSASGDPNMRAAIEGEGHARGRRWSSRQGVTALMPGRAAAAGSGLAVCDWLAGADQVGHGDGNIKRGGLQVCGRQGHVVAEDLRLHSLLL